jgi:hypothetical protein
MPNISTIAGATGNPSNHNDQQATDLCEDVAPFRPEGRVIWRPSRLNRTAVFEIYEAQSYLRWRYDTCFTTHVTITARKLGIEDHRQFPKLLAEWNKEMKRWLAIDKKTPRKHWTPRTRMAVGQEHLWVYVIENCHSFGVHAHELCVVPYEQRKAFDRHVRAWWQRASGLDAIDPEAIAIRHGRPIGSSGRKRHVFWIRYILKTADPLKLIGSDGFEHPLTKIWRLRDHEGTPDVYVAQLHGVCRALGPQARRERLGPRPQDRFRSPLVRRDVENMFSDWEEHACWERQLLAPLAV